MSQKRICFLVSPIGKEGSETRKSADDLMELVVAPALHVFQFKVIRADKIPRPSVITADIIQLVQTADLCIIDLTGSNPNVFYECGRRHETGKPFIQLIRKDQSLPFDVAGIRTIQYDLSSARSVHDAVQNIQAYVADLSASGFETSATGESLSSVAGAIERIERKINQLVSRNPTALQSDKRSDDFLQQLLFQANPRRAYLDAYDEGDLRTAYSLLPTLRSRLGKTGELIAAASIFAAVGDVDAAKLVEETLLDPDDTLNVSMVKKGVASLVGYYTRVDQEEKGLEPIEKIVKANSIREDVSPKDEAFLINQLQKLLYALGKYKEARPNAERVVELCPDDYSYQYNLSLIYEKLGMDTECLSLVDRYMDRPNDADRPDADHLAHAAETYAKTGRPEDAKAAYHELAATQPQKAHALLAYDDKLRDIVEVI